MTGTITIAKGEHRWEFPADHPLLPAIRDAAPLWGVTISAEEAPGAATPTSITKEFTPMKPKDVLKAAFDGEAIDQATLMTATQARADKTIDLPTAERRFAKYVEQNPDVLQLLKAAPPASPQPIFATGHASLVWQREQHMIKSGVSVEGHRDAVDPAVVSSADQTLRNVAQGLVDRKMFTGPDALRVAIAHLKTSPRYGSLARAGANYKDVINGMLAARR